MKRALDKLEAQEFDVLVIGGGIYGATITWDAVLRGLSVACIEKNDFASGTSFNSLKIIHGGLRYLQHMDIKRMRESISERRRLCTIAPHQVFPLPCVMPTYGHAVKGPEAMRVALLLNDLVGFDRNRIRNKEKHLPAGRVISRTELLDIVPYADQENLTGGAVWYDAHMMNSERMLLSFLHAAAERGAEVANYVRADKLLLHRDRIAGVSATDMETTMCWRALRGEKKSHTFRFPPRSTW